MQIAFNPPSCLIGGGNDSRSGGHERALHQSCDALAFEIDASANWYPTSGATPGRDPGRCPVVLVACHVRRVDTKQLAHLTCDRREHVGGRSPAGHQRRHSPQRGLLVRESRGMPRLARPGPALKALPIEVATYYVVPEARSPTPPSTHHARRTSFRGPLTATPEPASVVGAGGVDVGQCLGRPTRTSGFLVSRPSISGARKSACRGGGGVSFRTA
jgi:hypothetical protein